MNSKYKFLPSPATGMLTEEDTKRYFSRLGFAVFGFSVLTELSIYLLQYLYLFLRTSVSPDFFNNELVISISGMLISIICIYGIGLPAFLLIARALPKANPLKSKMSVKHFLSCICITMLLTTIGSYISEIILAVFDVFLGTVPSNPVESISSETNVWVLLIFGVIIIPILEELFFRKIVCSKLLPLGEGYAIFVSAGIFSLIHGNFYQFAYAFLLGAFFSFIYVKTGKII